MPHTVARVPGQPPGASPFQTGAAWPVVYERTKPERRRWQYRVLTVDIRCEEPLSESRLNELGGDGWLLVGAPAYPLGERAAVVVYCFVRAADESGQEDGTQ